MKAAHSEAEVHGIQALPGWVDQANNDFRLTAVSPAIDSAKSDPISTGELDHDAAGNIRCDTPVPNTGTAPIPFMDRGAYEYVSGCGTTDSEPPSAPAGLAGTAVSSTQINLTWAPSTDNVGVTGYKVFLNGFLVTTVTDTKFSNTGLTANTAYGYTVTAQDAAGNISGPAAVTVTTLPGPATTVWEGRISASGNDAEQNAVNSTKTNLTSTDLELVQEAALQVVGMRFTNLTIPKNATISNAYIQFTVDEVSTAVASLTFAGEAVDNSAIFTTAATSISSRTKTSTTVSWTPPGWSAVDQAGAGQRTPNLAAVVQQIVNRGGWTSGNALTIIVSGSGKRVARAYDTASGTKAPLLHVEYSVP
jgi:chitodextrinase